MATIDRPQIELAAVDKTKQAFDSVKKSFGDLQSSAGGLQASFAGIASAIVGGAFAASIKSVANYGEELAKSSEKTGIAVESYARIQYAAKLADVENDALAKGMKTLAGNVYENDKAFAALGISTRNSSGQIRGMDDILGDVAEAFAGMEDGAGKSALAVRIFGKAGADLIPLLNQGRQGLKDAGDEAQRLGLVLGADATQKMQAFNDNLKRLEASSKGAAIAIGNELIPSLNNLLKELLKGKELFGNFASAIINLGTINPFRSVADNIKNINAELADLEKRKALFKDFGERVPASLDREIEVAQKRIEFLKLQQRQNATQIDDPSLDEGARLRARFGDQSVKKKQAPNLGDPEAAKRQADLYANAVKSIEEQINKTADLTAQEEELARIQAGRYGKLSQGQQDNLIRLAGELEATRQNARVQKEADEAVKKSQADANQRAAREADALNSSAAAYKDMIDPMAKYVRQLDEINKLRERGLLTADQAIEAEFRVQLQIDETLTKTTEAAKENDNVYRELGLTFSSAFGQLIIAGGSAGDVMKSLAKDVVQLIAKITILEPLAENMRSIFKDLSGGTSATGFIKSLFGGGQSGAVFDSAGGGDIAGRLLGSYATGTDYVPQTGPYMLHQGEKVIPAGQGGGVNLTVNYNPSGNGGAADAQQMASTLVPLIRGVVRGEINTQLRPGGAFQPA